MQAQPKPAENEILLFIHSQTVILLPSSLFAYVRQRFGRIQSSAHLWTYTMLILLRKHIITHFGICGIPGQSVEANAYEPNTLSYQMKMVSFLASMGLSGQDNPHLVLTPLITKLKYSTIPDSVTDTQFCLNKILEAIDITPAIIRSIWIDNSEICEAEQHELLRLAYLNIHVQNVINQGTATATEARNQVSSLSSSELAVNILKLALEMWTLDYHIGKWPRTHPTHHTAATEKPSLDHLFPSDYYSAPQTTPISTVAIVDDMDNVVLIMPAKTYLTNKLQESADNSSGNTASARIAQTKQSIKKDMNHPYNQMKMSILMKELGYDEQTANYMLKWHCRSENACIPYNLLQVLLTHCALVDDADHHAKSPKGIAAMVSF